MKRKALVCVFLFIMISTVLSFTTLASGYIPSSNYGSPQNIGVSFDFSDDDNWDFVLGYGASEEIRSVLAAEADGRFGDAGFMNLGISVEVDYKLENGQWKSDMVGAEGLISNSAWFNVEEGKYTDQIYIYCYDLDDCFTDGVLSGGKSYFDSHTMYFRLRFCIDYNDENDDYTYYSSWSDEVSYNNGETENPAVLINHTPVLKSAELKKYDNGEPYLFLTIEKPHDDIMKLNSISNQEVHTNVWLKVGSGEWKDNDTYGVGLEGFEVEIDDYFNDGGTSFDSFVYDVKFRYEFDYENYPTAGKTGKIYSPFSNVISHGMPAYSNASSWAQADLDKAQEYGLITDRMKNNMSGPITREEFAELATRLYEVYTGQKAEPAPASTFTDTTNPEILKAFKLGIVAGVGNNKFAPQVLINREQMAAMLNRAVKVIAPTVDLSIAGAPTFADEKEIESYFVENVKFMAKNGFIGGVGNNKFAPKNTSTREQAVLIALRVYETYK